MGAVSEPKIGSSQAPLGPPPHVLHRQLRAENMIVGIAFFLIDRCESRAIVRRHVQGCHAVALLKAAMHCSNDLNHGSAAFERPRLYD